MGRKGGATAEGSPESGSGRSGISRPGTLRIASPLLRSIPRFSLSLFFILDWQIVCVSCGFGSLFLIGKLLAFLEVLDWISGMILFKGYLFIFMVGFLIVGF